MTNKITKREKFDMLLAIEEVANNEMLVDFINHEKELIAKKSGSGLRKPTARQVENEKLLDEIPALLSRAEEPMTATNIKNVLNEETGLNLSVPRVSALLKKLVDKNEVNRTLVKGSPVFEVA